ncbi:MAG: protein phosphatase 2C domain-containing protein [Planctomycetes bacterium]|nr:protein phosphatase 2C domain-containing protein [Planctomycetota bacterium]
MTIATGVVERRHWLGVDLESADCLATATARIAVFTRRSPAKDAGNEDGAFVLALADGRSLVAVADGVGGYAGGARASAAALTALERAVCEAVERGAELRDGVLDGFESADREVRALGIGAGTMLCCATVENGALRLFHVGDSAALVTGQRGRLKHLTVMHSPVGYAVEAGLLDADEAIHHADRHLVSNAVGLGDMRIEIGPLLRMAPRDTLVLASDGLWDNLRVDEVVRIARSGALVKVAGELQGRARERMLGTGGGEPAKPDDLVFVVFRGNDRRSSPIGDTRRGTDGMRGTDGRRAMEGG